MKKIIVFFAIILFSSHSFATTNHYRLFEKGKYDFTLSLDDKLLQIKKRQISSHSVSSILLFEGSFLLNDSSLIAYSDDSLMKMSFIKDKDKIKVIKSFEILEGKTFKLTSTSEDYLTATDSIFENDSMLNHFLSRINNKKLNKISKSYSFIFLLQEDTSEYYNNNLGFEPFSQINFNNGIYELKLEGLNLFKGKYEISKSVLKLKNRLGKDFIFSIHKDHLYPIRFWLKSKYIVYRSTPDLN